MGDWTLFSNHGHVLLYLAGHTEARLRDVAGEVGITERAVQKIVRELQDAGYLSVTKRGRCNRYRIHGRRSLRHPIESHCTLSRLVRLIVKSPHGSDEPDAAAAEPATVSKPQDGALAPSGPESRPESRLESKPRAKSEAEPEAKPKTKHEAKLETKAETKAETKPESKPETKPETPATKPATRAAKGKDGDDEPAETRQQGSLF